MPIAPKAQSFSRSENGRSTSVFWPPARACPLTDGAQPYAVTETTQRSSGVAFAASWAETVPARNQRAPAAMRGIHREATCPANIEAPPKLVHLRFAAGR